MNILSKMEGQEVRVELKYCERCGGLWLRPQGADGVLCTGCHVRMAAMPDPGEAPPRKGRARRKARTSGTGVQGEVLKNQPRIDYLQGVATVEVRA